MDVSIIIINYNTATLTQQCIKSVYQQTAELSYEIIVVDNASADHSIDEIEKEFPHVIFIRNAENYGFGIANNIGAKVAKGQYLLLLNSDTILINNAIKGLYDFISEFQNVGICGANLFSADGKPAYSYYRYLSPIRRELNNLLLGVPDRIFYGKNRFFNYMTKPLKVANVTGACLMISAELYQQLGGFDKDFFMYSEDFFLNYCITRQGYNIYNIPSAKVVHLEGKSGTSKKRIVFVFQSIKILLDKINYSLFEKTIYKILLFLRLVVSLLFSIIRTKKENINMSIYSIKSFFNILS